METVRISGLVRMAEMVRREMAGAVSADRRERLRSDVSTALRQMQEILDRHQMTPELLPAPSRRAYRFLAGMDWENATAAAPPQAPPPTARFSWPGLGVYVESMLDKLARAQTPAHDEEIHRSIAATSRRIEAEILRRQIAPAQIMTPARALRAWLALLAERENLDVYLGARRTAQSVLDTAAGGRYPTPLVIHFRPMSGIFRLRTRHDRAVLSLPTPMIGFDAAAFGELAETIFRRSTQARHQVHTRMLGDAYQAIHAELESLGGVVEQTRGTTHDLGEAFDRVNGQYFAGAMARPRLTWSKAMTGWKFGHYDYVRDTVMISRTLDQPGVPQAAVDFVMYHELLHKKHGIRWSRGRRYVHTAEFTREEKRFHGHADAEAVLKRLAGG